MKAFLITALFGCLFSAGAWAEQYSPQCIQAWQTFVSANNECQNANLLCHEYNTDDVCNWSVNVCNSSTTVCEQTRVICNQ